MTVTREPLDRFAEKVEILDSGCWRWTGKLHRGWGQFRINPRRNTTNAHRAAYELLVEPVPAGLAIDHLCRNRACVNPDHLEAVEPGENTRRAKAAMTHCKRGHRLDGLSKRGHRFCTICQRASQREWHAKRKGSSP